MEKTPSYYRRPTPSSSFEEPSFTSTSTEESDGNPASDDPQAPSTVPDAPGTKRFWQRARAQSVLEALDVPSQRIAALLNLLPLNKFDELFSGHPPPLRVTFHPDDKRPMLAWWNGALTDSTLHALVEVCHGLRDASNVYVCEVFADVLLDIARQPDTASASRARLLKWCARFLAERSTIELSPDQSFLLLRDCKKLLSQKKLPERECHLILNRLLAVGNADGYQKLLLKDQLKLIKELVKAWSDRDSRPPYVITGQKRLRRDQLVQYITGLHTRARDENDDLSAKRALVLLQMLQRTGGQPGKEGSLLGTFKELVGQVGEQRANKQFDDRGEAIARSLVLFSSDDGFIAKPVPEGPSLTAKRLLTYLTMSTEGPSRLLARDMVVYLTYGREHFKHVFTPGVVCSLWLAHAHINPQERHHILKGILSTNGVPLGKAFEDLTQGYAAEFGVSIAKELITVVTDHEAGQLSLVVQTSILRAIVGFNQLAETASGAGLKLFNSLLRPFCQAFLSSRRMADRLEGMLNTLRPTTNQRPSDVFENWIGISTDVHQLFHNDNQWLLLHEQLTHAVLVHVLARDHIETVCAALLRMARNELLPGKGESAHARLAAFLSQALADEEVNEAQLRSWAEIQVSVRSLVALGPHERHEAHKVLAAFHAAKSLATGSDSRCRKSDIAEVYKRIFLFEIHAADGDHFGALRHLELAVSTYIAGGEDWGDRAADYAAAAGSSSSEEAKHIINFCSHAETRRFMFDPDRLLIKALRRCLNAITQTPAGDHETRELVAKLLSHDLE